jgi:hypothetical protein
MMNEPVLVTLDQADWIVLAGGKVSVSTSYYLELLVQAQERIQLFPQGEVVTAQWLLGVQYWRKLSARQRQTAGLCISRMSKDRTLPLIRLWSLSKTLAYYQLP